MTSFYFHDDTPFANGVDVKRLARRIKQLLAEADEPRSLAFDDALEIASKCLGARSYFDLRKQASDPDISSWSHGDVERLVQDGAISSGYDFPSGLPKRFDKRWQRSVERMFEQAAAARRPGSLEFIALVGSAGTGKTLLANRMCARRGGRVVDVEISLLKGKQFSYAPGSILVFDRSSVPPSTSKQTTDTLSSWTQMPASKRTLKIYRELRRKTFSAIPDDDVGHFNTLRDWVRDNHQVALVVSFADRRQVEEALRKAPVAFSPGNVARTASLNWHGAHVVDLDAMETYFVASPEFEIK